MFKYDIRDSLLVIYAMGSLVIPFALVLIDPVYWLLLTPLIVWINLVTMGASLHYHTHNNIFKNAKLNRIFDLVLSAAVITPVQGYMWYHTMHHKYNNDIPVNGIAKDPSSTYIQNNIWKYTFVEAVRDITGQSMKYLHLHCSTPFRIRDIHKIKTENYAILLKLVLLFVISWKVALYYLFVIHYLTAVGNRAEAWGEHNDVVDNTNFRANSVSNYSKIYNMLTLNGGYHQEHHVRPGVHWTQLPSITKTLPKNRTVTRIPYVFNGPWRNDLVKLFKGK